MNTEKKGFLIRFFRAESGQMDLLTGSLWDKVLLFTLPIVATNILQQLFNTADIAVVGQVVGNAPLAAVGCSGPIVTLFITLFSGLAIGANAVISRHIGAGDKEKVREAVHVSMAIAIIFGLLVMVVGESITRPLLEIVGTPANVMNLAVKYLRIYFLGSVFLMLYNFEAAILRAGGDTRKPVLVLIVTGAVNIVLNLFFVIVCRMNVEGVALATLISNVLSAFILLRILTQSENILQIRPKNIHLQKDVAKVILLIGIPAAIQGMLFNIANIVIQSGVNSLGSDVVAGSTVGFNIEIFVYYIVAGFGQASITFNSQNLGAGNLKRCAQATRWCVGLGFIMTVIVSCLIIGFREFLAGFFTSDETVIRIAVIRIMVLVSFEIFNMLNEVMSGTLRGLGYSILPAFLSVFFVCGVRILWLLFIFPLNRTFEWLITVYPLSWIFTDISLILAYFLVKKRLYTQRIKKIEV